MLRYFVVVREFPLGEISVVLTISEPARPRGVSQTLDSVILCDPSDRVT